LAFAARIVVFVVTVEATELAVPVPRVDGVRREVRNVTPLTGCVAWKNVPETGTALARSCASVSGPVTAVVGAASTVTCPRSRAPRSAISSAAAMLTG
jgi:hypothetical protein